MKKISRLILSMMLILGLDSLISCNTQTSEVSTEVSTEASTNESPITSFRICLSRLHIADQKNIYARLSPEYKSALWRDRLQQSLLMSLSNDQKSVLQKMLARITPEIYNPENVDKKKQFESFAREWLTLANTVFVKADTNKFKNISMMLGEANNTKMILQQQAQPDCDCVLAGAVGNCPIHFKCKTKPCRANWCGIFWIWTCDALCVYNP